MCKKLSRVAAHLINREIVTQILKNQLKLRSSVSSKAKKPSTDCLMLECLKRKGSTEVHTEKASYKYSNKIGCILEIYLAMVKNGFIFVKDKLD